MSLLNKHGLTAREMEYLAPKTIRSMNRDSSIQSTTRIVGVVLIFLFLGLFIFRTIQPLMHAQAAEPVVMVGGESAGTLTSFCKQAVLDHDSYGRDLSDSLKDYCGL